ncbi:MAG TPA: DUF3352 domain-containing protein [Solirubrobacterales bacterium]|nr:DUF3352 domain-containing protein [Solirubrobacterales bacterium]
MKSRLLIAALAAAAIAALAGCGSGSSGADVASLAPPGAPVFVEGDLRPEGELKANVDAIAKQVAGVDNLGELIVEELESSAAGEGESLDFEKEVEPWLGDRGGVFFEQLEEGDEFSGTGVLVESTDTGATQEFIDERVKQSSDTYRSGSYEGVDFELGGSEGHAIGVVGDFLVIAEDEKVFTEVVDASDGESLGDEDAFTKAISAASDGSLADVYVDVGKLIDQGGGQIDPTARQVLQNAGIDPSEATAVASIVPGSEQIAVELSSDLAGQEAPTGDASQLLGELPAEAFAGFAVSGFGKQLEQAIDSLDAEGVPGTIPPHQLKKGLKELGIDLEGLAGSVQDAGVFATGASKSTLGGALVLSTKGSEATKAIANLGLLLRHVHVAGVTALNGKYSGFSVRSDELGEKPLVVAAKEGRVAIGYGLAPTVAGLTSGSGNGRTLSDDPAYSDAVASLGDTPIGGFADGPAALHLADALVPNSEEGFEKAKKYLKSIRFLALGSASQGDLATARLIVGLK